MNETMGDLTRRMMQCRELANYYWSLFTDKCYPDAERLLFLQNAADYLDRADTIELKLREISMPIYIFQEEMER